LFWEKRFLVFHIQFRDHWENGKRTPQPFLTRRLVEMKEELDAEQKRTSKGKSE